MNLKDLATNPDINLPNGRTLSKVSDHDTHSVFINHKSIKEHDSNEGNYSVELAIAPHFKFVNSDEDFATITQLIQDFGKRNSFLIKLSSHSHIYFESMHSVYGRKSDGKPIKLTYIKTHIKSV
jgi:hypothetical protein